jgi:hypothetical protein
MSIKSPKTTALELIPFDTFDTTIFVTFLDLTSHDLRQAL